MTALQLPLNLSHRPSLRGEDFFVSDSNRAAVDIIDQWPGWPHFAAALIGPEASGKTHLASVWQSRSGAHVISGESLTLNTFETIQPGTCLVLTRPERIAEEQALFHLLNWIGESEGFLLMTSRVALSRLSFTLPDLQSRLKVIPSVRLGAPDDGLLGALMAKQFADRQIVVNEAVAQYVLARVERSCAAVSEIVEALDAAALAEGRAITVPLARKVLENLFA